VRATVMYGAGDVRVEQRPDATVRQPTDAVVRVVRSAAATWWSRPLSGPTTPATSAPKASRLPAVTAAATASMVWTAAKARPWACHKPRAPW
jgi:hypothetical protein